MLESGHAAPRLDHNTAVTDAKVRVSYSPVLTDGVALDGTNQTIIVNDLPLGTGNTTWSLSDVPTGRYKVVVAVEDGQHAPVEVAATTLIAVTDQRAPSVPTGLRGEPLPGELLVLWTPNVEKDVAGYEIGFGVVDPAQPDDPNRFVYLRDMGPKDIQLPSGDALDAKLWGLTDNQPIFVGIRAYDQSGNRSDWSALLRAVPWALSPSNWTPIPNGAGGLSSAVEIVFETALISETLPGALQLLAADGTPVPGVQEPIFTIEGDQVIGLRFLPATPLVDGAIYTALVKGNAAGIAASDGRRLPVDYTWSFTASAQAGLTERLFLPVVAR